MDKQFLENFKLIRGEIMVNWETCEIKLDNLDFPCKALLTNYRLYLVPDYQKFKEKYELIFPKNYFKIPIHHIQKLDLVQERTKNFKIPISINLKDQRTILILFKVGQGNVFCSNLLELVQSINQIGYLDFAKKYNFDYHPKENGWNIYNPEEEYKRQGLTNLGNNSHFRKTELNQNFSLCDTYPKYLICPNDISDEDYRRASEFRTKNRVPTLSYFYYKSKGTVWRSSQVKGGIMGNRNLFDEKLVNAITLISEKKKIAVFDCRPYLAAYANKLKGAGPETVQNYHSADLTFCNIDNIHAARNAIKAIYSYLNSDGFNADKNFMSKFDNTKWTEFIFLLIKKSIDAAKAVRDGLSVLIHCSDGWDRASQMTAFTQFLVDPYFRTLRGYMVLVEKDFLSFGHNFKSRNGYYDPKGAKENQVSPIFLQFLDATSQLLVQYPMYFEFNMNFLVFVANHISTGKYGTFLFNNEKEREVMKAKKDYCSIWTDVLENKESFINNLYDPKTREIYCFTPNFSPHQVRLWSEFFMQNTQLNFTYNYENYINLKSSNANFVRKDKLTFEDEIMNQNSFTAFNYYNDQIITQKNNIKKEKENSKALKEAILDLVAAGVITDDSLEGCKPETKALIKKVQNEKKNNMFSIFSTLSKQAAEKTENSTGGDNNSKPEEINEDNMEINLGGNNQEISNEQEMQEVGNEQPPKLELEEGDELPKKEDFEMLQNIIQDEEAKKQEDDVEEKIDD